MQPKAMSDGRVGAAQRAGEAAAEAGLRGVAHSNQSRRLRTRISPKAPMLTASSSTTPWKSGCQSGSKSKTKSRSPMVRKASAPKMAPMALPRPPKSDDAAEDDGGDGVEGVGVAGGVGGLAGVGVEGEEEAAERGEEAGEGVGGELGAA